MKNIILLALATFLSINLFSQQEYNYPFNDWSFDQGDYYPIAYKPSKNVKTIVFNSESKSNKKTEKHIKTYNEKGQLLSYYTQKGNEEKVPLSISEYDGLKIIKASLFKKGKLYKTKECKWSQKGNITEEIYKNKKQKEIVHKTWQYNQNNSISSSILYKPGTLDTNYKWVYEYYPNNRISRATLYNHKGKVEKTWSYECNEEGVKLEKREKETQVCRWEKSMDSLLVRASQEFDEKGKIVKHVSKYTLKDTLLVETSIYDTDNNLTHKATYDKTYLRPTRSTMYKKGKITYDYSYKYENKLKVYESLSWKGKQRFKKEFKYNNEGLLEEVIEYDNKDLVNNRFKLAYEY